MLRKNRPRFRIHRIDTPVLDEGRETDVHYRAFWTIEDTTFRVHIWDCDQWARCAAEEPPPPEMHSLNGRGWMLMQPIDA